MKTEYEAKFLQIDIDAIRSRLRAAGATLEQPLRLLRRIVYESPQLKAKNAYIRVRDEGHRVTLTYKQFDALALDGAKELEVVVSDFHTTVDLLAAIGLTGTSYQESRRENWRLGEVDIMIDEWPWLVPYIEIEAEEPAHVQSVAKRLGLDWADAAFGDVMVAYRHQYPHLDSSQQISVLPEVKFGDPLPPLFQSRVD